MTREELFADLHADILSTLRLDHGHSSSQEMQKCKTCSRRADEILHVVARSELAQQQQELAEQLAAVWAALDGTDPRARMEFPIEDVGRPENVRRPEDLWIRGFDALWALAIEESKAYDDRTTWGKRWSELTIEEKWRSLQFSAAHALAKRLADLRNEQQR